MLLASGARPTCVLGFSLEVVEDSVHDRKSSYVPTDSLRDYLAIGTCMTEALVRISDCGIDTNPECWINIAVLAG